MFIDTLSRLSQFCLSALVLLGVNLVTVDLSQAHDQPLTDVQREISERIQGQLTLTSAEKKWLAENQIIRLGFDPQYAPYIFSAPNGGFQGVAADYLAIIEDVLDVHFEPIPGLSWSEILEAAKARELDVIATASITKEREEYLGFSDFFIPTPIVIMSRHDEESLFPDANALIGKKVALVRNYYVSHLVSSQYPDIIPLEVETPLEGLQALATGKADAYVGVLAVNVYMAQAHGLTNLSVAAPYKLEPTGQRFAFRKDWSELRTIMDKVLALISSRERNRLMQQWVPAFERAIPKDRRLVLSPDEARYVAERGPVTMCIDPNWMPYEKIDASGKHIGIAADYIRMFADMTGLDIELVPTKTWAESETFAEARKCDILSMLNESERRARYLNFTEPYVKAPVVLVARDDVAYLDGLKSLIGQSIGMVEGYVYNDVISQEYPGIDIVHAKSMDDVFAQVSQGGVDAAIGSLYIVTTQIQQLGLSNLKIAGHTEFKNEFRVGVRNDDPILLGLFEKAVAARDPTVEAEILQRWITVRLEQRFDYTLLWQSLAVVGIIIAFLVYRGIMTGRYNRQLQDKNEALERLSQRDSLTGVFNRMKLDDVLSYETTRAQRTDHGLAIILMDIDRFKGINDTEGHQTGDAVLIDFANLINGSIRQSDTFGRWGGEEFLVICPEISYQDALILAEKLRTLTEQTDFVCSQQLTASFGVASYQSSDKDNDLLARADQALYLAKDDGRNCVRGAERQTGTTLSPTPA